MKDVFATIGVLFVSGIVTSVLCYMFCEAVDAIKRCRRAYKFKHRYEKPPTAKCFCHDCIWHSSSTLWCVHFKIFTTDDTFCNWALPTCKEEVKE